MKPILHVLHIRKTGGSAVRAALAEFKESATFRIIVHPHEFTLHDVQAPDVAALFVRDPVSRFVSGFNSRLRQGRPKSYVPWSAEEVEAFSHFQTPNELAEALDTDSAHARAAMFAIPHLRHHLSFWTGTVTQFEASDRMLFVGETERLDEDFERFKRVACLPVSCRLPDDPIVAHRTPAGFSTTLSSRGEQNVRAWYKDDQEIYSRCVQLARCQRTMT